MRLSQKTSLKALRTFALTASVVALTGCSVFESYSEIKTLNNTAAVGSPFTQALADEYRRFANEEYSRMFDYPDALHFARKGLAAAAGKTVMPEPVTDWNLTAESAKELGAARGRLIVMLDQGARETAPAQAARAQASFDCWIEQQEENWRDGDAAACHSAFMKSVQELEASVKISPPPVETVVQPLSPFNVDTARPMAPENAMYLVFFNWNSTDLGGTTLSVLDAVAQEIKSNPPATVNVIGHTDTSGTRKYNQRLALKRANKVRAALVERGVDANLLRVDARGEDELLTPTADDVREPANRRVNISFQ